MLTELVNTLVTVLGQNAANTTPAIPPGIPIANAEGKDGLSPLEGGDVTAGGAQVDTDARRRCARRRRRTRHENRGDASGQTRDSVFNRLERVMDDPNLDDGYDSENEHSAGSRENTDLRARLNAQRARLEQQAESRPPVRATPEEECLSQMQAKIDRLLAEQTVPDPVRKVP